MSNADKTFDKLGYTEFESDIIIHWLGLHSEIIFHKKHKNYYVTEQHICMDTHLLINEKLKELGWLD